MKDIKVTTVYNLQAYSRFFNRIEHSTTYVGHFMLTQCCFVSNRHSQLIIMPTYDNSATKGTGGKQQRRVFRFYM